MSVTVRLEDEIDVSRGDMICRPNNQPTVAQDIDAMICWMDETAPLRLGGKYSIKHTTRTARTIVKDLQYRLDVNTLHRDEEARPVEAQRDRPRPAAHDRSRSCATTTAATATTGGFILVDEATNRTVAAGMITDNVR